MRRAVGCFACLLAFSTQPAARTRATSQVAPAPGAAATTEIRLERNCFGCPTGSVLVLRRDGTATLTTTGSKRAGTSNRTSRGRVSGTDFDQLARELTAQQFFELDDEYADPTLQDGQWSAISATRGGQEKSVHRRNGAGPRALDLIERAIDMVRARIAWQPDAQ